MSMPGSYSVEPEEVEDLIMAALDEEDDPDWEPDEEEQEETEDVEMDNEEEEEEETERRNDALSLISGLLNPQHEEADADDDEENELRLEFDPLTGQIRIVASRPPTLSALRRLLESRRVSAPRRPPVTRYFKPADSPIEEGRELLRSGEFGPLPRRERDRGRKFKGRENVGDLLMERMGRKRRHLRSEWADVCVPNSVGTEVAVYRDNVYSGQFSNDGSFFYSCVQDFKVYIYDTRRSPLAGTKSIYESPPTTNARRRRWETDDYWISHRSSLKEIKTIRAREENCSWTITDANLSPSNDWLIYSSITPVVHLVNTRESLLQLPGQRAFSEEDQICLDFSTNQQVHFGIWSIRFSADAREIVAGGNRYGGIYVYDIERKQTTLNVVAHRRDVNAVAFADEGSSNVLISGSDDNFVKVWDRRSLASNKPSGVLIGHTEGVTYVSSKGDGRYALSNGKDQGARLWDLRKMRSSHDFENIPRTQLDVGIEGWDYRGGTYHEPKYREHPLEGSVMIYRGHSVLRTLIRAHFSPPSQTGQRYIYSGSADGRIHIWNLDGTLKERIDRHSTTPLISSKASKQYNDPSFPDPKDIVVPNEESMDLHTVVRDVAWHPYEPYLISTAWGSNTNSFDGSLAKHPWKSYGSAYGTLDGGEF
ncbi:WD40 repeat-like protein [Atractiella rhizophila]|nr:WD40 repeat-like protein [Atractiella rhizophila]